MGGRYERNKNKLLNKFEKVWHGVGKEGDHREFLEISENLRMVSRPETTAELVFWKKVSLLVLNISLLHNILIISQGVAANTRSNTTAGKRSSERAAHKDRLQETPMTHFAF